MADDDDQADRDDDQDDPGSLAADPLDNGRPGLAAFLSRSPGYVVNEDEARESPCLRRELRRGGDIVFSKGVVGPLDEEQRILYCDRYETLELTPKQQARLERFADAAHACHTEVGDDPHGQRMGPYLTCMERELQARERETAS